MAQRRPGAGVLRRVRRRVRPRALPAPEHRSHRRAPDRGRPLDGRDPRRRGSGVQRELRPARRRERSVLRAPGPGVSGPRGVHRRRRRGACGHGVQRRRRGARQACPCRRVRQVRLRRRGGDQRRGREYRCDRPPTALEGAAQDRRLPELQAVAADADGRGTVPLPAPARLREIPARAGQRPAPTNAQLRRLGLGSAVRPQEARPGSGRSDGGHRPRRHRARDRGLLRGRRGREHHRPPGRDHLTPVRRRGRTFGGTQRRHRAAGRPGGVLDRLRPGCAVPAGSHAETAVRRARELHALPADPARGRPRPVLQRLQLLVLQPAQRRDGGPLDRRRPRGRGAAARRRGHPSCGRRAVGIHGRGHEHAPLPRHQDHPVLDAQCRRGARRPRSQHQCRSSRLALAEPDQSRGLPSDDPDAARSTVPWCRRRRCPRRSARAARTGRRGTRRPGTWRGTRSGSAWCARRSCAWCQRP